MNHDISQRRRTKPQQRRGSSKPLAADGTDENKAGALYTGPDARTRAARSAFPSRDETGDADDDPVCSCQTDGSPEYTTRIAIRRVEWTRLECSGCNRETEYFVFVRIESAKFGVDGGEEVLWVEWYGDGKCVRAGWYGTVCRVGTTTISERRRLAYEIAEIRVVAKRVDGQRRGLREEGRKVGRVRVSDYLLGCLAEHGQVETLVVDDLRVDGVDGHLLRETAGEAVVERERRWLSRHREW